MFGLAHHSRTGGRVSLLSLPQTFASHRQYLLTAAQLHRYWESNQRRWWFSSCLRLASCRPLSTPSSRSSQNAGRVLDRQADFLITVNDEDGANRETLSGFVQFQL